MGCILLLYVGYPLVHNLLVRFPKTTCGCFTVLYMLSLYAVWQQIPYVGFSGGFTICACEMFLGMAYIRFGLHQKKKTIYAAVAVFLLALLLRDKLPADSLTLALAFLMMAIVVMLADNIRSDAVKDKLLAASGLTYPIFLVHHFLSDRMVQGFNLENMPRLYVYVLFAFFVAASILLAIGLKNLGNRFGNWIRGNKIAMPAVCIMLLLSYIYTLSWIIRYQLF